MFTHFQKQVFGQVLEEASDQLSNNGCNDFQIKVTERNKEDVIELVKSLEPFYDSEYVEEMLEEVVVGETIYLQDYALLNLLKRLVNKAKK